MERLRKMRLNVGPINMSGGEKRLNVAFSRAKHDMAVVSSIDHGKRGLNGYHIATFEDDAIGYIFGNRLH
jgi:hypothetical protein